MSDTAVEQQQYPAFYQWLRLAVALLLSTIGGVGMWSVVVVLPNLQAEFGVARGAASFPYTTLFRSPQPLDTACQAMPCQRASRTMLVAA